MRVLLCLLIALFGLGDVPASAMTASSATLEWTPTNDSSIRYELRWQHFANGWAWEPIVGNLDSTTGHYLHVFPVLPETPGDRGACWDARAVRGGVASPWLSETNQQQCLQVPLAAPIPAPIPLPTPEPIPAPVPVPVPVPTPTPALPATVTMSGDTVTIQCDKTRFTKMKTVGSGTKRTITCLK